MIWSCLDWTGRKLAGIEWERRMGSKHVQMGEYEDDLPGAGLQTGLSPQITKNDDKPFTTQESESNVTETDQLSRFFSLASLSYFSKVLLST